MSLRYELIHRKMSNETKNSRKMQGLALKRTADK